ncbi:ankyrin repeat domain-containing protein, partial [Aspergillus saccharolyticus JOP 1030-1]
EILEWLNLDQGPGRHHEIQGRRTPGTGKWIFNQPQFQEWLKPDSPINVLWCIGGPGSGKSTIMSLVVDEVKHSRTVPDEAVAYYYCDYRMRTSQPAALVLEYLVKTFVEQLDSLPQSISQLYNNCRRDGRRPKVSELETILNEICSLFRSPFVLLDALDEFSPTNITETRHLIRLLNGLARNGARVFVTSRYRPEPVLEEGSAILEFAADGTDIRRHIMHVLSSDDSMVDILDPQLEEEICSKIVAQAGGMFLLAVLHLQNIRDQVSRTGIRRSLNALSSDLSGAYDKSFDALWHQSEARKQLALNALRWVACAYRPLTALELRHALATDDGEWDFDNLSPLRLIINSCCGLLSVDGLEDHAQVRLVHHTLQQYLQATQPDWYRTAHTVIARTCLRYLLLEALNAPMSTLHRVFVYVQYSKDCWGLHAAQVPLEDYVHLAMQLFNDASRLKLLFPENERIHGLHIAAGFGLTELIIHMAKAGEDAQCLDVHSQNPLQYACAHNHMETALALIKLGTNVAHVTPKRDTALFMAVGTGNVDLVRVLLDNGAPP